MHLAGLWQVLRLIGKGIGLPACLSYVLFAQISCTTYLILTLILVVALSFVGHLFMLLQHVH
jgi:hypothetical protein